MPAARSLKACALQWLAQREQSRVELRRKLLRRAGREKAGKFLVEGSQAVREALADYGVSGNTFGTTPFDRALAGVRGHSDTLIIFGSYPAAAPLQ